MENLIDIFDLMNESSEKKISRLKEINARFDELLEGNFTLLLLFKTKEWRRLGKEFDMIMLSVKNEVKALKILENMIAEKNVPS